MTPDTFTANRFVLDPRNLADLRSSLKSTPQAGLRQAAQQFESLMLQMMLKSMREATPQTGMMDSDQTRFLTSLLDQQLAQNLAGQGKLGFAKLIEQQLGRNVAGDGASAGLGKSPDVFPQDDLAQRQAANYAVSRAYEPGAARWRNALESPSGAVSSAVVPAGAKEFVGRILPYATNAAYSLGVPVQFVIAHSALESSWGKSEIRTEDGKPTYNLFGVKAGRGWQGPAAEVQTTEYVDGVAYSTKEKFRVYRSYADAFRDYTDLLRSNARFSSVVGQQDGAQFSTSLQRGGYATDPSYADKLNKVINGNTLRQALFG